MIKRMKMIICLVLITLIGGVIGFYFAVNKLGQQRKLFLRQKLRELEAQIYEKGVKLCILQHGTPSSTMPEGSMIALLDFWEQDYNEISENIDDIKAIINLYVKTLDKDRLAKAIRYLDVDGFSLDEIIRAHNEIDVDTTDAEYFSVVKKYNTDVETELWEVFKSGFSGIQSNNIIDWQIIMNTLKQRNTSEVQRIWSYLNQESKDVVAFWAYGIPLNDQSKTVMINGLNQLIRSRDFYDPRTFASVALDEEGEALIDLGLDKLSRVQAHRLNRLLIEAAFPMAIERVKDFPNLSKDDLRIKLLSNVSHDVTLDTINVEKQYFFARFNDLDTNTIQSVRILYKRAANFSVPRGDKIFFYNLSKEEFNVINTMSTMSKMQREHTGQRHIILLDEMRN